VFDERLLQRMEPAVRGSQSFDGDDDVTLVHAGERQA
jgi:hypothetical protein